MSGGNDMAARRLQAIDGRLSDPAIIQNAFSTISSFLGGVRHEPN
jgi:hypothetical protein